MSLIKMKAIDKSVYFVTALILSGLITWISYQERSVGGILIGIFFLFIGLMLSTRAENAFLLLASIVFSLALGEFCINSILHRAELTFSKESGYAKPIYWAKSDLGVQARPGKHTSKELTPKGEVVYDVVYSIEQDGFRTTPLLDKNNTSNTIHINFFGCSFMFGEGLNDNETLPYFIHSLDNRISVKNFGWHGYGVHQALRILESNRDTKGNINFLLTAPWHAERSACLSDSSQGAPRYRLSDDGEIALYGTCNEGDDGLISRMANHSQIHRLLRRLIFEDNQDRQIDLYLAIIEKISKISRVRNQRLIVGFIQAKSGWFHGSYSNLKIVERLAGMGIEILDLTLAQSAEQISREYYLHPLDKHPSARANETRARLLKSYLEKRSIL